MPFKSLKNHIGNLATGFVSGQISNFLNSGSAKDSLGSSHGPSYNFLQGFRITTWGNYGIK